MTDRFTTGAEVREHLFGELIRRKMMRAEPVPVVVDGVRLLLFQPSFDEVEEVMAQVGDRGRGIRLLIERNTKVEVGRGRFDRVFSSGDETIIKGDAVLMKALRPIMEGMLSSSGPPAEKPKPKGTAPIPEMAGQVPGIPMPLLHPAALSAIDIAMALAALGCRRCNKRVDEECEHRPARDVGRCSAAECGFLVPKKGDKCLMHAEEEPNDPLP